MAIMNIAAITAARTSGRRVSEGVGIAPV